MAEQSTPRERFTRRTFLGWWMSSLLTATVVAGGLPILVFLWPAPPKDQKKVKFDAPKNPNSAFIMADGGGDNAAGDLAFGGFAVKDQQGKVHVLAINCSHLGCSIALNDTDKTFDCPCHGSRFHLDGTVRHGPAGAPLSNLTWEQDSSDPSTIAIEGIVLGF